MKKTFTIFAKNKGEWKKKNSFSSRKLFPPPVRLKIKFIWAFFLCNNACSFRFFFACSFIIIIINAIDQWKKNRQILTAPLTQKSPNHFFEKTQFYSKTNKQKLIINSCILYSSYLLWWSDLLWMKYTSITILRLI